MAELIRTGPRKFPCSICHKKLSCKETLKNHVLVVHQNSGRFRCDCGKTFQNRIVFEDHLRVHTGERPFQCNICQTRFICKSNLNSHYLNNHAEKKFQCQFCGARFGRAWNLKSHLVIHSKEKPFRCEACSEKFATKNRLQTHMRIRLDAPLDCKICGRSFLYRKCWTKHQAEHLANQRETSEPSRDRDQKECGVIEQPSGSNGSGGATYRLSGKTAENPVDDAEFESRSAETSESDHQDSDDESSEPDEATEGGDVLDEEQNGNRFSGNEWRTRKTNAENWTPDGGARRFDGPVWSDLEQKRTEREYDSDGQTGNGAATSAKMSAAAYESRSGSLNASPTILLDLDKPPEPNSVCSPNLKVVFGVEYRAPE